MTARHAALPLSLPPRLISRDAAAAYVGVSSGVFNRLVETGAMPKPKKLGDRRLVWDVRALDRAVDTLPDAGTDPDDDTWDDVDGA